MGASMPTTIIFVVDSSPAVRRMVEQLSVPEGCDVRGFHDGPTALEAAQQTSPHLIIADYHVENMTFTGFCQEVSKLEALAETNIIALISPSDHIDDTHLRSLGVTAFLKKPFQPEHLIQAIKNLTVQNTSRTDGAKKKSHSWPPVSQMTDAADGGCRDDNQARETEDKAIALPPQPKEPPLPTASAPPAATTEPEEAMASLLNHLLQSMSERTEKKVAELLPQLAGKELAALVAKAVGAEISTLTAVSLSEEKLTQRLESLLAQALPKMLEQEMPLLEPLIRRSIAEIASPLITERLDRFICEQTAALHTTLPDMVREQLGSLEGLIKEEIQLAAAKQTAGMIEALVRAAAREQIEQTVQQLVPDLAEAQIKAELTRLTAAA